MTQDNLPALAADGLGFMATAITTFEGVERLATVMAKCGTMPAHLQGKPSDCFRVVVQAAKWRMDPFAVAECTSVVHGRLCFEGKLVAAVLQSMGAIVGRLDYDINGSGQQAQITVTGTPKGGRPQSLTGTVKQWRTHTKKDGREIPNAWDSMPETMLVYRGTRQWARLYAPEAILGVYTPDEVEDIREVEGTVVADPQPARTGSQDHPRRQRSKRSVPASDTQDHGDSGQQQDQPEQPTHPAVEAAKALYRRLVHEAQSREAAGRIIERVSRLCGGDTPLAVPSERLDDLGERVSALSSCQDIDGMAALLHDWDGGEA